MKNCKSKVLYLAETALLIVIPLLFGLTQRKLLLIQTQQLIQVPTFLVSLVLALCLGILIPTHFSLTTCLLLKKKYLAWLVVIITFVFGLIRACFSGFQTTEMAIYIAILSSFVTEGVLLCKQRV